MKSKLTFFVDVAFYFWEVGEGKRSGATGWAGGESGAPCLVAADDTRLWL